MDLIAGGFIVIIIVFRLIFCVSPRLLLLFYVFRLSVCLPIWHSPAKTIQQITVDLSILIAGAHGCVFYTERKGYYGFKPRRIILIIDFLLFIIFFLGSLKIMFTSLMTQSSFSIQNGSGTVIGTLQFF